MKHAASVVAVILVVPWATAGPAVADDVRGTRGPLAERQHDIHVTLQPGHARLVVRRSVENAGARHDQALFDLYLPESAAAVGLRTLGLVDGRPHWFPGDLMEAEAAARKYERLTGIGGAYPKDPALLSWRSPGHLLLQVFPVAPGDRKTIEYTLVLPTEYSRGQHRVRLPRLGSDNVAPRIFVRAGGPDPIRLGGLPFPSGGSVRWSELVVDEGTDDGDTAGFLPVISRGSHGHDHDRDGRTVELALAPTQAPTLDGRLAQMAAGPDQVLLRYRIHAAPRLSRVPTGAQLVILLDGSRSLSDEQRASSLAAASAYLSHFETAQVQVLTFDRKVTPLFARFAPRAQAQARLERFTLPGANGSHVDLALRDADRLLARQPPGPRRVVLLTDLRTRSNLKPERLTGVLAASGAVLHIGVIDQGQPALAVLKDSPWAPVSRRTGGLLWEATASDEPGHVVAMRRVYEEWARPLRLHRFEVAAPGLPETAQQDRLDEGEGTTLLQLRPRPVPWVEARGELWSRPVRLTLRPDAAETRLWAALVFGDPLHEELSEREMMVLARHGRAVSPVTSYLAIEPGVRPSTEGLNEGELGLFGTGGSGYGRGAGGRGGPPYTARASGWVVRQALNEAWRRCQGRGPATVRLETTLTEVADVPEVTANASAPVIGCLREGAWALELPGAFVESWREWTVAVDAP
jgi:hypothetical protein